MADNIIQQNITHTLEINYMPYVMSVIVSRAIPEIDGFKPSHRKLLYTMYKMGLLTGQRIKSADVVGQTMRLNPHGDGAIYETLVRLTKGYDALLHPFIDSKGNLGKHYSKDMAYAASRYTEVKLDQICGELFRDIDKNSVDFIDNYNGTTKEPLLFPTTFPNVLTTPNLGIAVGMASNICSFNLKEVCAATIAYIKNPDCDLTRYLKAPDMSTGGQLIYNEGNLRTIYETGRGSFKLRAKYRFDKKNSCIEVIEIPYTTTIEAIIDRIVSLVKLGKLREINDVRDETDLKGLKIAIDIKKNADPELCMRRLFSMTTLYDSFSCNFNILVNGKPRVMGVTEILREWLIFRKGCISRQIMYDIDKKTEKLHLLDGLSGILLDIDKAIRIIRDTESDAQVIPNLMNGFSIDNEQAEYIAEIKLRNLNRQYLLSRVNERDALINEIADYKNILENDWRLNDIIIDQLKDVSKKYGAPRRTEIVQESEAPPDEDVLIDDYAIRLYLTEHNYFKKIPLVSLRSSGEQNIKPGDFIRQELETSNKADIVLFSDKCNVYKLKAYELSDCKTSSLGEYLTNLLNMEDGERIIYMTASTDYSGYMLFAFENGKAAKVGMENYATKINRRKLVNAYNDKAKLCYIEHIREDGDYMAFRGTDKASLFNTLLLTPINTKSTPGVQIYTLKKNSILSRLVPVQLCNITEPEYYRTDKIPSSGHFITDRDKKALIPASSMPTDDR